MKSIPDERPAVGIDIGGTKIAMGVVASDGSVVYQATFPTESERGFADALVRIERGIREIAQRAGIACDRLAGIGIGCAGPVDPTRGSIHNLFSLAEWDGCEIVAPLHASFGVPTRIENDADAAALGEWHARGGRVPRLLMLTLGTGIGGGLIVEGAIYRGAGGAHPEIGHVVVADSGPLCFCGRRGCLESLASGTGIAQMGGEFGFADSRAVFRAAGAGDEKARLVVDRALRAVAAAGWTLCHTFLPERIVLSGGIAQDHFELFASAMRDHIAPATLMPQGDVAIEEAVLRGDAGIVGAARLVLPSCPT